MNPFRYVRVESPSAAMTAVATEPQARFVAGGTSIVDLMKIYVESPPLLIDINALPLAAIERRGDRIECGALARLSDLARNADVRALLPFVAGALEQSASPQLRNMATVGGNLLQRTRCPYFRDVATPCNKRVPGSGCAALGGDDRRQAVLGTSERCIAVHPSDLAVALTALDASVHVIGLAASREIALRDFYRLPGDAPHLETTLENGELIAGVALPLLRYGAHSAYVKARDRAEYDFALASAAVAVDVRDGIVAHARIALGGIATIPWRSLDAERELTGAAPGRAAFARAADAALAGARSCGSNGFKIPLAKATLVRALELATA